MLSDYDIAFMRFIEKVRNFGAPNVCWNWLGWKSHKGYGMLDYKYRKWLAHVWLRTYLHGPAPAGMENDHICRNRACINVCDEEHVKLVTHSENNVGRDFSTNFNASLTHCKHGHPFSKENTRIYLRYGKIERICRACQRACQRAYYYSHK